MISKIIIAAGSAGSALGFILPWVSYSFDPRQLPQVGQSIPIGEISVSFTGWQLAMGPELRFGSLAFVPSIQLGGSPGLWLSIVAALAAIALLVLTATPRIIHVIVVAVALLALIPIVSTWQRFDSDAALLRLIVVKSTPQIGLWLTGLGMLVVTVGAALGLGGTSAIVRSTESHVLSYDDEAYH